MLRTMANIFEGRKFYESTFDTETGTLVRLVEAPNPSEHRSYNINWLLQDKLDYASLTREEQTKKYQQSELLRQKWGEQFGWRRKSFSPSPETVDISITDWCNFGCSYCYQDSKANRKPARKTLVSEVINSFDHAPYQIAIGGGEPTSHPDFPEILFSAKELGTVPNYTTAGHIIRPEVIEATNQVCGGVAMTYHAFKGIDWFKQQYFKLKSLLKVQLNIHLIADCDVAKNLNQLANLQREVGTISLVLLAYYSDVGRGTLQRLMPKNVYNLDFPEAIKQALCTGMKIAFSEGLLPYFISRPDLGIETQFATRSEGLFSCYVSPRGELSSSSFDKPFKEAKKQQELGDKALQLKWNKLHVWSEPSGSACFDCRESYRCATPSIHHYFACRYADHNENNPPLTDEAIFQNKEWQIINESMELGDRLGRKLTEEEYKPFREKLATLREERRED